MFFEADRARRRPRTCARATAISFLRRRAGSSAASGWLATPEGKKHVFPLKNIDTPGGIRHLHVSCGAGGGKKSGFEVERSEEKTRWRRKRQRARSVRL